MRELLKLAKGKRRYSDPCMNVCAGLVVEIIGVYKPEFVSFINHQGDEIVVVSTPQALSDI
jgi:hypothetical protein